jgi:hypothetical protein
MIETNHNTNQNSKHQNPKRSTRRNHHKGMNMKAATATTLLAATALSYGITSTEAFTLPSQTCYVPFTQPGQSRARALTFVIHSSYHRTASRAGSSIHADSGGTALSVKKDSRTESRYGVRRRVRSVLERAKNRTGVQNKTVYLDNNSRKEDEVKANSKMNISNIESSVRREDEIRANSKMKISDIDISISKEDEIKANSKMNISDIESSSYESYTFATQFMTSESVSAPELESVPAPVSDSNSNLNGQEGESNPIAKANASPSEQANGESTASAAPQREEISTAPPSTSTRIPSKTIDRDSSINVIAEAASIGGLGPSDFDYRRQVSTTPPPTKKKKSKPASTYSVTNDLMPAPGDDLIPSEKLTEVDALKGDVSAAFSMPPPPLPFTLPEMTLEQKELLRNGERVQFQSDMGREGSGFVVMDVKAPSAVVWECLLDFYSYPNTIPTVRDVQMFTNTHLKQNIYSEEAVERQKYEDGTLATLKHGVPSVTRAAFTLSKFRLKIAAIHKYRPHPRGDYMIFTLDPACTNAVLKNAKGVWHTQSNPDGRGDDYTRVWLLCELSVSPLLPKWITDYAARRAMPRATTWVKPHVEAAAELWYKGMKD